jgi:fructose-1,6-bisphosphatase/inositol monophosphatase family enzyme
MPNWPRRAPITASSAKKAACATAATSRTAGSSIRSTAPPTSCTASRTSPSRSRSSAKAPSSLADSVVACGLPHIGRGNIELGHRETGVVQRQVAGLRRFGAAALDLAWVAAGRVDAYWERDIKPWDMGAGILLVREAGGTVMDCDGGDDMFASGHILAGNETIAKDLLRLLKTAKA